MRVSSAEQQMLNKEYRRIRKNIQNKIYRAKKKGIKFKGSLIPKVPKTITEKSIKSLEKFTTEYIYSKGRITQGKKQVSGLTYQKNIGRPIKTEQKPKKKKSIPPKDEYMSTIISRGLEELIEGAERDSQQYIRMLGKKLRKVYESAFDEQVNKYLLEISDITETQAKELVLQDINENAELREEAESYIHASESYDIKMSKLSAIYRIITNEEPDAETSRFFGSVTDYGEEEEV